MDTLYIDRKGATLDSEGGRLILRVPEQRPLSLPLAQVSFIVASARVELSSTTLLALEREGVTLVLINPRQPDNHLVCTGQGHGNSGRRLAQYAWYSDERRRLEAARELVSAKLLHQFRALARHRRHRPDLRRTLTRAMGQITLRWRALPHAADLCALRGLEGAAAAAYFGALQALVAPAWGFQGRRRRPPPDPVNALLSLTYTLLHGEALRALAGCGLDPSLGALHDVDYGRASLACDLQELLRTDAETWVLSLCREGSLRSTHFQHQGSGACLLTKEGRALYYPLYQQQASRQWRSRCRTLAEAWRQRVAIPPASDETIQHG